MLAFPGIFQISLVKDWATHVPRDMRLSPLLLGFGEKGPWSQQQEELALPGGLTASLLTLG